MCALNWVPLPTNMAAVILPEPTIYRPVSREHNITIEFRLPPLCIAAVPASSSAQELWVM